MGCDIHCYVEFKRPDWDNWDGFGGRINPGRHYSMFGFMAGVRTDNPHVEPRGVPDDLGYRAFEDWGIWVSDSQEEPTNNDDGSYSYSRQHAEEHVSKGYCQYIKRGERDRSFVTNCDWHTSSWLTADEFELCIAGYLKLAGFQINTPRLPAPSEASKSIEQADPEFNEKRYALNSLTEYWAILTVLRCFEAQGLSARLVFWFDN
jgi:hypothetical protein